VVNTCTGSNNGCPIFGSAQHISGAGGYGNSVIVRTASPDWFVMYGHMSAAVVEEGDVVVQGQVVGRMGNSG